MSNYIENLPVELLVDILLKSQSPRTSEGKSPFENVTEECQRPVSNWVPLMLVSHLCRDVILEAGSLWPRLPVTNNLVALQHRLLRSQDFLLDLLFGGSWESALPLIIPHASRIRAVITTPRFHIDLLPSPVPLFHVPLPALERVYVVPIMNLDYNSQDLLKLRDVGSILNETPHSRVKAITSHQLLLPPKESCFWSQRLLHLDIRSEYDRTLGRDDISAVLRETPGLVSLAIIFPKYALPPNYLDQMTGNPPVSYVIHPPRAPTSLLRLRMLALARPTWLCGPVLHDIDTPSLVHLYVQTASDPRPDTENTITAMFPEGFRHILARLTRLHIRATPFDKHGFRIGDCHCHCTTGDSRVGDCPCEGEQVSSDMLYLSVQNSSSFSSASEVLCRVFKGARVESLEVNYLERQERGMPVYAVWEPVLETFPGLRKVMLYYNDQKLGGAMVDTIEVLKREGLNSEMGLVAEHVMW